MWVRHDAIIAAYIDEPPEQPYNMVHIREVGKVSVIETPEEVVRMVDGACIPPEPDDADNNVRTRLIELEDGDG